MNQFPAQVALVFLKQKMVIGTAAILATTTNRHGEKNPELYRAV